MKTVSVNYYTIEELKNINGEAYKKAYYRFNESACQYYSWMDEVLDSVEKFLDLFDCKLRNFCVGSVYNDDYDFYSNYAIEVYSEDEDDMEEFEIDELQGEKLKQYLQTEHGEIISRYGMCPLAGIWIDIDVLEPLHEYLNEGKHQDATLDDLINKGLSRALNSADADFEYQGSEEAFVEYCEANDIYFDINGNMENL